MPSPSYFAINMRKLGWWSSDALFNQEFEQYSEKIETIKANFLALLSDPFIYNRFTEIAKTHKLDPIKLIASIKIKLPHRKIHILDLNKSQLEEIVNCYRNDISKRTLIIIRQLRSLMIKGVLGRKQRIESIRKNLAILTMLNAAGCMTDLIKDLAKAFGAIENLQRRYFPDDLDKYTYDKRCSKSIQAEVLELVKTAKNPESWVFRK